jgi:hypothetical protein
LPGVALLDGKVYVIGGETESSIIANGECYDPRDNTWTSIACMVEPRCEFGLCALDNNLYAFGGWVGEDIGGSIEIYDPVINFWTLSGKLPEPRFSMGVIAYDGLTIIQYYFIYFILFFFFSQICILFEYFNMLQINTIRYIPLLRFNKVLNQHHLFSKLQYHIIQCNVLIKILS